MIKYQLKLNSKNEINKFYNKLWLYKSLIFKFVLFDANIEPFDEQLKIVIKALNIKNRRKRITYIYDETCEYVDNKNKGINICGFKNNQCYVQRKLKNGKCNGCCRKCLYQTKEGCPTKNIACKLFNCSEVTSRYNTLKYNDLKILKLLSLKNRIIIKSDYFSRREDVLKDLYSYSLIYSSVRIVYRLIRNYIYFTKKNKKYTK